MTSVGAELRSAMRPRRDKRRIAQKICALTKNGRPAQDHPCNYGLSLPELHGWRNDYPARSMPVEGLREHAFDADLPRRQRNGSNPARSFSVASRELSQKSKTHGSSCQGEMGNNEIQIVEVPELKAHATALPFLAYVLGQTQMTTLLAREGCCPVRVPIAERFAVHKLVVSQLRTSRDVKSEKDVFQASVILAALGEKFSGAIETAVRDLPVSAGNYLVKASAQALKLMQGHQRASEELSEAITQLGSERPAAS